MNSNIAKPPGVEHQRKLSRKLGVVLLLMVAAAFIALAYSVLRHTRQLSEKDFTVVEQKMNSVYANMGVTDKDTAKTCYHYKDSMSKILKCEIEMAGYVPAKDSDDLSDIKDMFDKQLKLISNTDEIWRTTYGSSEPMQNASFGVKDSPVNMGCLASVEARNGKLSSGRALPEKDLTGKVALVLACGGGSSEAYFEMR